jgi:hypothetical protein
MRLENYLTEAGEGGFAYERRIYSELSIDDLIPDGFSPAGSGHGPDGMFLFKDAAFNLEIKLDLKADYGQVELRNKHGKWEFGGRNEEAKELYNGLGILDFVEKEWGKHGQPRKETVSTKNFTREDEQWDRAHFKDAFITVPLSAFEKHYLTKNVNYIQIGGYGFYYIGKDVAGIGCPRFAPQLRLRIRRKMRSSKKLNGYGFLTALQIAKKPKKSKFDIDKDTSFLKK